MKIIPGNGILSIRSPYTEITTDAKDLKKESRSEELPVPKQSFKKDLETEAPQTKELEAVSIEPEATEVVETSGYIQVVEPLTDLDLEEQPIILPATEETPVRPKGKKNRGTDYLSRD